MEPSEKVAVPFERVRVKFCAPSTRLRRPQLIAGWSNSRHNFRRRKRRTRHVPAAAAAAPLAPLARRRRAASVAQMDQAWAADLHSEAAEVAPAYAAAQSATAVAAQPGECELLSACEPR